MDDAMGATAYRDPTRPVTSAVEDLLARMTLDEKVAQLTGILPFDLLGPTGLDEQKFDAAPRRRDRRDLGGRVAVSGSGPSGVRCWTSSSGTWSKSTRLGIPAIVHHEALAGLVHQACADFPTAITLAASWDPSVGRSHERRRAATDAGAGDPPGVLTEPRPRA